MKPRRWIYIIAGLIAAVLLAFLLRGLVQDYVILPLARLFWNLRTLYRSIPQAVYWVLLLVVLVSMTISSFSLRFQDKQKSRPEDHIHYGDVQQMAFWIQRSRRGVYSKWHLARSLAELALDILQRRKGSVKREQQLEGPGWAPPAGVQEYLEAALKTSYADYPRRSIFDFNPPTPFDHDFEPTVAYLESLMEDDHDHQYS